MFQVNQLRGDQKGGLSVFRPRNEPQIDLRRRIHEGHIVADASPPGQVWHLNFKTKTRQPFCVNHLQIINPKCNYKNAIEDLCSKLVLNLWSIYVCLTSLLLFIYIWQVWFMPINDYLAQYCWKVAWSSLNRVHTRPDQGVQRTESKSSGSAVSQQEMEACRLQETWMTSLHDVIAPPVWSARLTAPPTCCNCSFLRSTLLLALRTLWKYLSKKYRKNRTFGCGSGQGCGHAE